VWELKELNEIAYLFSYFTMLTLWRALGSVHLGKYDSRAFRCCFSGFLAVFLNPD